MQLVKIQPFTMESFSTVLLNITWMFALIVIAGSVAYFSLQSVKNMHEKRIIDNEIFDIIKEYSAKFTKLSGDIDNLGKKVRDIEKYRN
ncbi:MAG: hypothetical protein ACRC78_11625 [Planktothrix sp.]